LADEIGQLLGGVSISPQQLNQIAWTYHDLPSWPGDLNSGWRDGLLGFHLHQLPNWSTGSLFAEALKAVICLEMADAGAGLVTCPQRKAEPESIYLRYKYWIGTFLVISWSVHSSHALHNVQIYNIQILIRSWATRNSPMPEIHGFNSLPRRCLFQWPLCALYVANVEVTWDGWQALNPPLATSREMPLGTRLYCRYRVASAAGWRARRALDFGDANFSVQTLAQQKVELPRSYEPPLWLKWWSSCQVYAIGKDDWETLKDTEQKAWRLSGIH